MGYSIPPSQNNMLRLPAVFLSLILLSSTGLAINEHLPGFGPPVLAVDVDNNIVNKYNDRVSGVHSVYHRPKI
jgi:hypothetical protein